MLLLLANGWGGVGLSLKCECGRMDIRQHAHSNVVAAAACMHCMATCLLNMMYGDVLISDIHIW